MPIRPKHAAPGLWRLLDSFSSHEKPAVLRGDANWGNEPIMQEAEQRRQPYLFKLRLTTGVKRAIERAMYEQDWQVPALVGKARTTNCGYWVGAGSGAL